MIYWLASYPRSGNTLFRTILLHCFGIKSYSDEVSPEGCRSIFRQNDSPVGHLDVPGSWEEFYEKSLLSEQKRFIKTHQPPRDDQPCIYIVRDGRMAVESYAKFHKNFNHVEKPVTSLIVGDDVYGHWSGHYKQWNVGREAPLLLLRYEDIVHIGKEDLRRVAEFIGFTGKIKPWDNPFSTLQQEFPLFFNSARKDFKEDLGWSLVDRLLFREFHGGLMEELAYALDDDTEDEPAHPGKDASSILGDIGAYLLELASRNHALEKACNERLQLIEHLDSEAAKRLKAINRLDAACTQRLEQIASLQRESDRRLEIIRELEAQVNKSSSFQRRGMIAVLMNIVSCFRR